MNSFHVEPLPVGEYGLVLSVRALYLSAAGLAAVSALFAMAAAALNKRERA